MGVRDEEKLELEDQFIEFASQYPNPELRRVKRRLERQVIRQTIIER